MANWQCKSRKLSLAISLVLSTATLAFSARSALAQIIPDGTLGAESSVVTPINSQTERIDGGATRGANLFHSFQEFNIGEGRGAYFANPAAIENIFSRVTGNNPSHLLGTLGVLGDANLFFLNPNGIIFGPNARLDMRGSLVTSTASSLMFPDGSQFSATNPQAPPLLTIDVPVTVGLQFEGEEAGAMINAGDLEAGSNLTLVGGTVVSTGQLSAPRGDLAISTVGGMEADGTMAVVQLGEAGQILGQEIQPLAEGSSELENSALSWSELVADGGNETGLRVNDEGKVELLESGTTLSAGDIAVQQLSAQGAELSATDNLILVESQLGTVGDLRLLAKDTVRVRDSIDHPFIAAAGGQLLVQGNQGVDIFALNHPHSGLFSGGDMVLRSTNPVGGDAHYWSGGSFRIEQLDESLGDFFSLYDPVIRSLGDVSFNNYFGNSLHIFSGGSVTVPGTIIIAAPDTLDFIAEDITLSNGTVLSIDGSVQPTLDVRAGIDPTEVGIPLGLTGINGFFINLDLTALEPPTITDTATSADITINGITMFAPDGVVFLTNQYEPNSLLTSGVIEVGEILTSDTSGNFAGNGGSVIIDGRSDINLTNRFISSSASGNAGNITLIAKESISLANGTIGSATFGTGNAGDINVQADSFSVTNGSVVDASNFGQGNAGDINIQAESLFISNGATVEAINSRQGQGDAGDINIRAGSLSVTNGAILAAISLGQGDAGSITINASDTVSFDGVGDDNGFPSLVSTNVQAGAVGNGGTIEITTGSLFVTNDAELTANNLGLGNAGSITIKARDTVSLSGDSAIEIVVGESNTGNGGDIDIQTRTLSLSDNVLLTTSTFGQGNAGNVQLNATESISVIDNSSIATSTLGQGNAGNITIQAGETVYFDKFGSAITSVLEIPDFEGIGNGGDITIETGSLSVTNEARLIATTLGLGNAGDIKINARDTVSFDASGAFSNVGTIGVGKGGIIDITTGSLFLTNGAQLQTQVRGQGNAGNVKISARDNISFEGVGNDGISSGIVSKVSSGAIGDGGNIDIKADSLSITNGAALQAQTNGQGNAGSVTITVRDKVSLDRSEIFSTVGAEGVGIAGDINIDTGSLFVTNGAQLQSLTRGRGDAGDITINARDTVSFDGVSNSNPSAAFSTVEQGTGRGGKVNINTGSLAVTDGARIVVSTVGLGNAGDIIINARDTVSFDGVSSTGIGSGALSTVEMLGDGDGGRIDITTGSLTLTNGAQLAATTRGQGNAGSVVINARDTVFFDGDNTGLFANTAEDSKGDGGSIFIDPRTVIIRDGARVAVDSRGVGKGGDIDMISGSLILDNQAAISAITASTDGGNITLQISDDPLLLRRNSSISTTAGEEQFGGDGGNITINAPFILAFPSENSDITANAGMGNGGSIDITTNAILGIEFRDRTTDLSDMTVSSTFGAPGTFSTEGLIDDNLAALITLPQDPVNTEISQGCQTVRGKEAVAYFEIGRGGSPPHPEDPLNADTTLEDWISLEPNSENRSDSETTINSPHPAKTQLISPCLAQ
ncbi:MAG: filamentous hemagglutinin N-terminal domain-containing protein [Symploca sp. SIO2E9]|nr:filamentous hemagglutinin N-terminal domain-containing protein [Symploca sp. SIO2E9]